MHFFFVCLPCLCLAFFHDCLSLELFLGVCVRYFQNKGYFENRSCETYIYPLPHKIKIVSMLPIRLIISSIMSFRLLIFLLKLFLFHICNYVSSGKIYLLTYLLKGVKDIPQNDQNCKFCPTAIDLSIRFFWTNLKSSKLYLCIECIECVYWNYECIEMVSLC